MDTMKLGNLDIPLPFVARDLCREAVTVADQLRGNTSEAEYLECFKKVNAQYLALVKDIIANGAPILGFDPFDVSNFPEELADENAMRAIFAKYTNSSGYVDTVLEGTTEDKDLLLSANILRCVIEIQTLEANALDAEDSEYSTFMASVSMPILALHKLLVAVRAAPSQAELFATNLKRKRGARKGGAAKANRMAELQDLVLQEAREFHHSISATKAAMAIFKKLSDQGKWLQDDKGKNLLKDPTIRFTAWIRADRKQSPK